MVVAVTPGNLLANGLSSVSEVNSRKSNRFRHFERALLTGIQGKDYKDSLRVPHSAAFKPKESAADKYTFRNPHVLSLDQYFEPLSESLADEPIENTAFKAPRPGTLFQNSPSQLHNLH